MTTTPEERAEHVVERLLRLPHFDEASAVASGVALIAQAIREAEDAALERAIACVSDNFVNGEGHYAIEAIRALKHERG